jgi:hypothetical protein
MLRASRLSSGYSFPAGDASRVSVALLVSPEAGFLLVPRCSILASTLITAARLTRAPPGRLLLVVAERHFR